ncbi:hypothetical protein BaRGS_00028631 [Batillaria attramentaria]|uniref:Uncharacterized protein n=1 Tax=Batillaria attramentaria TaxID=370345 RepID=A0ABD0JZ01_9CAEN
MRQKGCPAGDRVGRYIRSYGTVDSQLTCMGRYKTMADLLQLSWFAIDEARKLNFAPALRAAANERSHMSWMPSFLTVVNVTIRPMSYGKLNVLRQCM